MPSDLLNHFASGKEPLHQHAYRGIASVGIFPVGCTRVVLKCHSLCSAPLRLRLKMAIFASRPILLCTFRSRTSLTKVACPGQIFAARTTVPKRDDSRFWVGGVCEEPVRRPFWGRCTSFLRSNLTLNNLACILRLPRRCFWVDGVGSGP